MHCQRFQDVSVHLKSLCARLLKKLKAQIFDEETVKMIELTHVVTDVATLSEDVKKQGSVSVRLQKSQKFIRAVRQITSTLDDIEDNQLDQAFNRFLMKLEDNTENETAIASKQIIKKFLSDRELYTDVEVILHCICTAAVKVSVESNVSRFEKHFGKKQAAYRGTCIR